MAENEIETTPQAKAAFDAAIAQEGEPTSAAHAAQVQAFAQEQRVQAANEKADEKGEGETAGSLAGKPKPKAKNKAIALGTCLVAVAIVAVALFAGLSSNTGASNTGASSANSSSGSSASSAVSASDSSSSSATALDDAHANVDTESNTGYLGLRVKTEGYDADTSAPAIAHVSGTSDAGDAVDAYTALSAGSTTKIELPAGSYEVEFLSAINADGSLYEAPEGFTAKVNAAGIASAPINLTFKAAKDVTADEMQAAVAATVAAVDASNGSLDASIATRASENAAKNPNVAG